MGWRVVTAKDGAEAVEAAAQARPGLILLDINMPRMTGLDAARAIRRQAWLRDGPAPRIIVVSGHDDHDTAAAGIDDKIVKPLTAEALSRALDAGAVRKAG
jgi:two-component system KDP operon response regulator KdpE